jgi:quinol monooxygenase YgiN
MPETVEIAIVSFKDSSPPQSWLDNLKTFASTPGLITLYFGQQIEHPDKYNWVARWTSQSAIDDFHNNSNFKAWADAYAAPLATSVIKTTQETTGEPSVPLDSPCTEFFINHGASDDFHKARLDPFIQKLVDAKLPGLIGGSTGEYKTVINVNEEVPEHKEVILLLGWVNKEAHTALQGEGGSTFCLQLHDYTKRVEPILTLYYSYCLQSSHDSSLQQGVQPGKDESIQHGQSTEGEGNC